MNRSRIALQVRLPALAPLDKLMRMPSDDLLEYFKKVRPSRIELMKLLGELDFHPGSEAQKSLYKYAARQIAETGMFQRVAKKSVD